MWYPATSKFTVNPWTWSTAEVFDADQRMHFRSTIYTLSSCVLTVGSKSSTLNQVRTNVCPTVGLTVNRSTGWFNILDRPPRSSLKTFQLPNIIWKSIAQAFASKNVSKLHTALFPRDALLFYVKLYRYRRSPQIKFIFTSPDITHSGTMSFLTHSPQIFQSLQLHITPVISVFLIIDTQSSSLEQ